MVDFSLSVISRQPAWRLLHDIVKRGYPQGLISKGAEGFYVCGVKIIKAQVQTNSFKPIFFIFCLLDFYQFIS